MVKRRALNEVNCPVARTLDVVGDPWTLLVVREALFGVTRFDTFQRRLEIPRTTLSSRLATLVDHGVLEKRSVDGSTKRFEYALTDKGRALHPVVVAMLQWGDAWSELDHRPVTLVDVDGVDIDPVFVDRRSGRPLADLEIERRFHDAP